MVDHGSCCDKTAAKVSHLHSSNQRLTAHTDVPERERAQERAQRRRGRDAGEDPAHPAVAQHVEVVNRVGAGQHSRDHRGRFHARVRRGHAQLLRGQDVQDGAFRQPHHRHQTRRTDQVRAIEYRGYLMRCLHLSDAPSDVSDQTLDESNPPVPQEHSRVTTRHTHPPIGGSGFRPPQDLATAQAPDRQHDHPAPAPIPRTGPSPSPVSRTHDDADILIQRGGPRGGRAMGGGELVAFLA